MFRDAKVIRAVAGDNHSLVIMASSHVYVWGQPEGGRLGHPELLAASPYCLKVGIHCVIGMCVCVVLLNADLKIKV